MALWLLICTITLTASGINTERCATSPGSRVNLLVSSHKNQTGHWIISIDSRRAVITGTAPELSVEVEQATSVCDAEEIQYFKTTASLNPPKARLSTEVIPELSLKNPQFSMSSDRPAPADGTVERSTEEVTDTPTPRPHPGYKLFPGFGWYKAHHEKLHWEEARKVCKEEGGDLMVVETNLERRKVYTKLYADLPTGPWIGVHDPGHNGTWLSVLGEPVPQAWWYPGQPDNEGSYCTAGGPSAALYDYKCYYKQSFICEI